MKKLLKSREDTRDYEGTYTGTFSGGDTGTWTFVINDSGGLTGTIVSNATGEYTIVASVSDAGVLSGYDLNGNVDRDGTISGTWPGSANGIGISFSGQIVKPDFGRLNFSGVDASNENFGLSFSPTEGK